MSAYGPKAGISARDRRGRRGWLSAKTGLSARLAPLAARGIFEAWRYCWLYPFASFVLLALSCRIYLLGARKRGLASWEGVV